MKNFKSFFSSIKYQVLSNKLVYSTYFPFSRKAFFAYCLLPIAYSTATAQFSISGSGCAVGNRQ